MTERVLLVGGGGREHAIARAIAGSDHNADLYACASNRNPGIDRLAAAYETLDENDPDAVLEYAESVDATLATIGPETPLDTGVTNVLDEAGIYTFAPRQAEAQLECDKSFQREFMAEHGIPGTPNFAVFEDVEAACDYVEAYDGDVAVKPHGLTGGKGVRVTGDQLTKAEAVEYMRESDWDDWVIEERLIGEEFTIQAFVADGDLRTTPAVQDHKRAYEGDEGPNTGGMGSYSGAADALPFMDEGDYADAVAIMEDTVEALPAYKGVLYGQFMLTAEGPTVVEFNARFGDPEAMNTLPVLETDVLDVLIAARDGDPLPELEFAGQATVCKYAVPDGYPTDPEGGTRIAVDEESAGDALLFYASVDAREDGIYTTTSRSFAVVGVADSIDEAEGIAEDALAAAGEGLRIRHDIGTSDLVKQRIENVRDLRGRHTPGHE
ncbi:MAG: phosphoribosylamine--glycine ligase [Halobacteriales archaeon]